MGARFVRANGLRFAYTSAGPPGGPLAGGSLVERNLNFWTVVVALAYVANTIVLLKI